MWTRTGDNRLSSLDIQISVIAASKSEAGFTGIRAYDATIIVECVILNVISLLLHAIFDNILNEKVTVIHDSLLL